MKQARLPLRREKPSLPKQREKAEDLNVIAAKIIMGEPERYAGGMVLWAKRVLERVERERAAVSNR